MEITCDATSGCLFFTLSKFSSSSFRSISFEGYSFLSSVSILALYHLYRVYFICLYIVQSHPCTSSVSTGVILSHLSLLGRSVSVTLAVAAVCVLWVSVLASSHLFLFCLISPNSVSSVIHLFDVS
jgi:hypothetical protein